MTYKTIVAVLSAAEDAGKVTDHALALARRTGGHVIGIHAEAPVVVTLDDQQGQEQLVLETPAGQKVTLSDGPGKVRVEDSNGNSLVMEASGITITAAAQVKVDAANVKVSAGMVTVDAAMAKFSGVVKCEVLIATSVVGTSYTASRGSPALASPSEMLAASALLLRNASLPPRRMTALPARRQSAAASEVTLGRDS